MRRTFFVDTSLEVDIDMIPEQTCMPTLAAGRSGKSINIPFDYYETTPVPHPSRSNAADTLTSRTLITQVIFFLDVALIPSY